MIIRLFYILNVLFLVSGLGGFRIKHGDRKFSFSLIRALLCLALLAVEYIYFANGFGGQAVLLLLFSESVFFVIWLETGMLLHLASNSSAAKAGKYAISIMAASGFVMGLAIYCHIYPPQIELSNDSVIFSFIGPMTVYALVQLTVMVAVAWLLEGFWRIISSVQRWEYKYFVIGATFVCGVQAWSASYRLSYFMIVDKHFILLAMIMLLAWLFMVYAVGRHRLLNRRMFVSRKVVYSFVAPTVFAAYLMALSLISSSMKFFGWTMSYALIWFLVVAGLMGLASVVFSSKIRSQMKFFISTNLYVNKYEYRDEWLAFSNLLQGQLTETGVVNALNRILTDSLYTTKVVIWTGNDQQGYLPAIESNVITEDKLRIAADDPVFEYLKKQPYLYFEDKEKTTLWQTVVSQKKEYFDSINIVLLVPLVIDLHCLGLVGIGPEFTGGLYGHDDYDLLFALGSQTATALLAVKTAEKLAESRGQEAWNSLSSFVLHDIKNAANMLSLVRENATNHMSDPEFQQDMLESVDDALKRMNKVQGRLNTLKGHVTPNWQEIDLVEFIRSICARFARTMAPIKVRFEPTPEGLAVQSDPEILGSIFENLLLNAMEARSTEVVLEVVRFANNNIPAVVVIDNGHGIEKELLPNKLFEPFRSNKEKGSGVGLWQVRQLVVALGGNITAENVSGGGARFVITLGRAVSLSNF